MYKIPRFTRTSIKRNESTVGEMLEDKVERIMTSQEPIKDGARLIYTERKQGVLPEHNIRTDRFEIAIEAMDKVSGSYKARREERLKPKEEGSDKPSQQPGESVPAK